MPSRNELGLIFGRVLGRIGSPVFVVTVFLALFAAHGATANVPDSGQPANPEAFIEVHDRAAAALMAGRLEEALAGFNRALELNPKSALTYYNRGNLYYAKGDYQRAIADFDQAVQLAPGMAYAHMNRGNALSNLGKFDEALRDLNEAVRLAVIGSDALYNRAIVHVRRKDFAKAIADYEAAVERDTGDAEAVSARNRLLAILRKGGALEIDPVRIDTNRIVAEIEHARLIEHFLRLAAKSCFDHGDDADRLKRVAEAHDWTPASSSDLVKASSPIAKMIGGWTFSDRFSSYALMQSVGTDDRRLMVCSLTARIGSAHLMEDLKTGFEQRFSAQPTGYIERPGQLTSQYVIERAKKANLRGSLVFGSSTKALTMRFTFTSAGE